MTIRLEDGRNVLAFAYIYNGKNVLDPNAPLVERADMVVRAKGKNGTCVEYVRRIFEGLARIGLDDPKVTELWEGVKNHPTIMCNGRA